VCEVVFFTGGSKGEGVNLLTGESVR